MKTYRFQFRKYKVLVGDAGKPTSFRLCDTMGLEEGQGIDAADVPFLLDGNLPDRYRVRQQGFFGFSVHMPYLLAYFFKILTSSGLEHYLKVY